MADDCEAISAMAGLRVHPSHVVQGEAQLSLQPLSWRQAIKIVAAGFERRNTDPTNTASANTLVDSLRISLDRDPSTVSIYDSHGVSGVENALVEFSLLFAELRRHDCHFQREDDNEASTEQYFSIVVSDNNHLRDKLNSEEPNEPSIKRQVWLFCSSGETSQADEVMACMARKGAMRFDFEACFDPEPASRRSLAGFNRVHRKNGRVMTGATVPGSRDQGELEENLAVKFVSQSFVHALRREISIFVHAQGHPNIAKFYGTFCSRRCAEKDQSDDALGIVFEGNSTSLFMKVCERRSKEPVARSISLGICSALKYVHSRNIVVRDVTAENVLIDKRGRSFLASFGAALPSEEKSMLVSSCSAPGYGAPEVLLGLESMCGTAIDMFSFGVMLYFALTQMMPFSGSTLASVYKKTVKCNVSFVSGAFRTCSPALIDFLKNTLKREPGQRLSASMALTSDWLSVKADLEATTDPARDTMTTGSAARAQLHKKTSKHVHSRDLRQKSCTESTVDTVEAEDACEPTSALKSEAGNVGANDAESPVDTVEAEDASESISALQNEARNVGSNDVLARAEALNDEHRLFAEAMADAAFMMTPTEDTCLPIIPAMVSEAQSVISDDTTPDSRHQFDTKPDVESSDAKATDLMPRPPSRCKPLLEMPACITKRSAWWKERISGGKSRVAKGAPRTTADDSHNASEIAGSSTTLEAHAPICTPPTSQHRPSREVAESQHRPSRVAAGASTPLEAHAPISTPPAKSASSIARNRWSSNAA
eukprot:TRINITY_DN6037_c0_g1_i11.p1 TRINITY_DN6037_c0_g1~~TRINITY_DN6037_c0_g1_i11.p1  ORF type:complete len:769 (-),score=96.14 TRINITY_DN6037_c0_g1_i11:549-2855(-)